MDDSPIEEWYYTWADRHCKTFRLGQDDLESLLLLASSWQVLHSSVDLYGATRRLSNSATKLFPSDHRPKILEAIADDRAAGRLNESSAARQAYASAHGLCQLCENSGLVVVPHPELALRPGHTLVAVKMVGARAQYATTAVCCVCPIGMNAKASSESLKMPRMSLATYESLSRPREVWRAAMDTIDRRDRPPGAEPRPAPTDDQLRRQAEELASLYKA